MLTRSLNMLNSLSSPLSIIFGVFKYLLIMIYIVFYLTIQIVLVAAVRKEDLRLKLSLAFIQKMCRLALATLRVNVHLDQENHPESFLICNHLSYLDALILFAYFPSLFITSVEVKETPVLGQICQLAGAFFVERRKEKRSPGTVGREIAEIKEKFLKGFKIFLFPEGTSSDGRDVLPFKTAMLQIAMEAKAPITPLCLKYTHINDELFSALNADNVCWYGDMTFPDHLFKLCLQKSIKCELSVLKAINPSNYQDRFTLGVDAQQIIRQKYLSPSIN